MNEKDVQSQKLRTREGFGTRTPDAMIKFPRVAIGGGTLLFGFLRCLNAILNMRISPSPR